MSKSKAESVVNDIVEANLGPGIAVDMTDEQYEALVRAVRDAS
jgi:hypothetical protein